VLEHPIKAKDDIHAPLRLYMDELFPIYTKYEKEEEQKQIESSKKHTEDQSSKKSSYKILFF